MKCWIRVLQNARMKIVPEKERERERELQRATKNAGGKDLR